MNLYFFKSLLEQFVSCCKGTNGSSRAQQILETFGCGRFPFYPFTPCPSYPKNWTTLRFPSVWKNFPTLLLHPRSFLSLLLSAVLSKSERDEREEGGNRSLQISRSNCTRWRRRRRKRRRAWFFPFFSCVGNCGLREKSFPLLGLVVDPLRDPEKSTENVFWNKSSTFIANAQQLETNPLHSEHWGLGLSPQFKLFIVPVPLYLVSFWVP